MRCCRLAIINLTFPGISASHLTPFLLIFLHDDRLAEQRASATSSPALLVCYEHYRVPFCDFVILDKVLIISDNQTGGAATTTTMLTYGCRSKWRIGCLNVGWGRILRYRESNCRDKLLTMTRG